MSGSLNKYRRCVASMCTRVRPAGRLRPVTPAGVAFAQLGCIRSQRAAAAGGRERHRLTRCCHRFYIAASLKGGQFGVWIRFPMMALRPLASLLGFFSTIRPVVFVSLLSALILVVPDQMLELYIVYGHVLASTIAGRPDPAGADAVAQLAAGLAATLVLVCVVWLGTVRLLTSQHQPAEPARGRGTPWLAASIAAILPIPALLWGFSRAFAKLEREAGSASSFLSEAPALKGLTIIAAASLLGAGLVLALIVADRCKFVAERAFRWPAVLVVAVLSGLFVGAVVRWPVALPAAVGTLALVMLFLAMLCYVLVACVSFTASYGIPPRVPACCLGDRVLDLRPQ